ncbi:hypothetical protein V6C03_01390 [Methyloligella sp. 2.7D]|uniref:hypothetical protein n=1 Tax=unclassified Methyloligella TaxID=2625955 RepID=UPI00157D821F|nr:hypothetical protein [Methyloligella sp. GL2]QKP76691.1 hypothetical protein HT051_04025 [Methyloligella sp. GL2]
MTLNARTILFALLVATACAGVGAHPASAQVMSDDGGDGSDLDDGYFLNGEWHEPDEEEPAKPLFPRKKHHKKHKRLGTD